MDILIGTNNEFKQREMLWHLQRLPVTIHFLKELNHNINVKEDGATLLENAQKKAVEISRLTDWYVFTSDAGVAIPGLGQKWDMAKPQRLVGENKTDSEKVTTMLKIMEGLTGDHRNCQFHISLALALQGKLIWSQEIAAEQGYIPEQVDTKNIAPYTWMGRLWYYPELSKRDDQLTPDQRSLLRDQFQSPMKQSFQKVVISLMDNPPPS